MAFLDKSMVKEEPVWGNRLADRFSAFYYTTQRRKSIVHMLFVRTLGLILAIALCAYVYLKARDKYGLSFYFRFSHWAFAIIALMYAAGLVSSLVEYISNGEFVALYASRRLPWYMRVHWIVFNVAVTTNLMLSVMYFLIFNACVFSAVVGNYSYCCKIFETPHRIVGSTVYVVSAILVTFELVLSAIPVRLIDFYQVLMYNIVYSLVLNVFQNYTQTNIYNFNCNDKEALLTVLTCLILCFAMYVLTYTIDLIKCACKKYIIKA
ncbi:unknown [Euproctis pseudoconspersa nucleopolyhedrovirus]|uniref:Uncharacterized protein n=1 Tax=Euproctis pseudoconspersa nucleopolyhedrovirus TaxID=307467 RepID=C3TX20_9ABAC|nr:hypothetical protein EupsNPV_gp112 [Euproctis pseudoconspersa nucleopolyhedrovirus]ACO53562.1 unknown [Euproctis pseudoconspersa nucleopolyhedrovirus]QUJ09302.1 hypothetical protein Gyru_ORF107 [Gynaephora ruoergensis nucleopolyhedrovirus]